MPSEVPGNQGEATPADHIVLVGAYAPPYGGISVHTRRLASILETRYRLTVIDLFGERGKYSDAEFVFRCGKRVPFNLLRASRLLKSLSPDLVHFHVSALRRFSYAGPMLLKATIPTARKMITIHSGSFSAAELLGTSRRRRKTQAALFQMNRIVVVNENQGHELVQSGFDPRLIRVIPAFLPPTLESDSSLKDKVEEIRGQASTGVIVTSGCGLQHYGYHVLVNALARLPENERPAVVLSLYGAMDHDYVGWVIEHLNEVTATLVVRDITPPEFASLLSLADVYVRPTDRDGDAVAIREAACLGKRIVASDCVPRPDGSLLFTTDDPDSLAGALRRILSDTTLGRVSFEWEAGQNALLEEYRELLETRPPRNR